MSHRIVFAKEAKKDIDQLDRTTKRQLGKKLVQLSAREHVSSVAKKLHNHAAGGYRFRMGNYRLIFDLDGRTIVVLRLRHRKDIYR